MATDSEPPQKGTQKKGMVGRMLHRYLNSRDKTERIIFAASTVIVWSSMMSRALAHQFCEQDTIVPSSIGRLPVNLSSLYRAC